MICINNILKKMVGKVAVEKQYQYLVEEEKLKKIKTIMN